MLQGQNSSSFFLRKHSSICKVGYFLRQSIIYFTIANVIICFKTPTLVHCPSFTAFVSNLHLPKLLRYPNMSLYKSATLLALASSVIALPQTQNADVVRQKRDNNTCAVQPKGDGPVPTPDTAEAFVAYKPFSEAAYAATIPKGYVQTFKDLHAASTAQGYLGYTTLESYDTNACAAACTNTYGCSSFNIFFERAPTLDPAATCANPPSTTVIKCSLWGGPVFAKNAVNDGQWRNDFHVVISGSNGYINEAFTKCPDYKFLYYGNAAINAPLDCEGKDTYMGYKRFNDSLPYNPARCEAVCQETNTYNLAHPPTDGSEVKLCNFFNSYVLSKNGVKQGQVCSMYTKAWPNAFATNEGQYRGDDHYTISWSLGFETKSEPCHACLPGMQPGNSWTGGDVYEI
ncbi:hypothetical protein P154DRAFT_211563 [Amniculicola lignicola CBS 123094]|uniref:Apple domain-containing protein n=1 Tax=Amniculicola lignicola CBS 123094 TaxID=1392246 RepID=A0A6A5WE75_9PLEO|nr:hypothetical protein P154DRAFT_211563 [Amniculicola lignicola CBS 123094]